MIAKNIEIGNKRQINVQKINDNNFQKRSDDLQERQLQTSKIPSFFFRFKIDHKTLNIIVTYKPVVDNRKSVSENFYLR